MSSAALYDTAVEHLIVGDINWERDQIKVLLARGDYEPTQAQDEYRSDLSRYELAPTGSYRRGGTTIEGRSIFREGLVGSTRLMATDIVSWENVTGEFRWAIVYHARGGQPADDELIAFSDIGHQNVVNASITISFDQDFGVAEFIVVRTT